MNRKRSKVAPSRKAVIEQDNVGPRNDTLGGIEEDRIVEGLTYFPATPPVARAAGEESQIRENSDPHSYSPSHYHGFFHTDHLVPSVFFSKKRDHKEMKLYDDLSFRNIYDPVGDPQDHKELMTGADRV